MKFIEEYVLCMEKYVLVKKMFTYWLNMGLLHMSLSQKDSLWSENTLSGNGKSWVQQTVKKVMVKVGSKTTEAESWKEFYLKIYMKMCAQLSSLTNKLVVMLIV